MSDQAAASQTGADLLVSFHRNGLPVSQLQAQGKPPDGHQAAGMRQSHGGTDALHQVALQAISGLTNGVQNLGTLSAPAVPADPSVVVPAVPASPTAVARHGPGPDAANGIAASYPGEQTPWRRIQNDYLIAQKMSAVPSLRPRLYNDLQASAQLKPETQNLKNSWIVTRSPLCHP